MAKYQQYFQDMLEYNHDLFASFKTLHENYSSDPKKWKEQFDEVGRDVLRVIRKYENMLCSTSEGGKYGKFSENLSEKFWSHVRIHFPKIDMVGVKE